MNSNETRTLWISVGSALFAVFLLYSYTQEKSAELTKKFGAKERVVVAVKDINEMETIDETMLQIVERPVDFIEPNAITDPEDAVGLVALAPIRKEEQILENKILKPGPITGLSLQISPTKRAITIPIDDMRGVGKLIKPGDRIDVLAALDIGKGPQTRREIKTLLQDVVILATGLKIANELPRLYEKSGKDEFIRNIRGDTSFTHVTVEVSPVEAQNLVYILSTSPGSLFMTLRHPSDHQVRDPRRLPAATIQTVRGLPTLNTLRKQVTRKQAPRPAVQPKKKKRGRKPFIDL